MLTFTAKDILALSPAYFDVLDVDDNFILVKSLFTNHIWQIETFQNQIKLSHSHSEYGKLHKQKYFQDV